MKKNIHLLAFLIFLISCSSSKNSVGQRDPDTALQNMVQVLEKNPKDEKAIQALPALYAEVQHAHLSNIKKFSAKNKDRSPYWVDIISEYKSLQNAYNLITNSVAAQNIISPVSYNINVEQTKEAAAMHYYQLGESLLRKDGRKNAQEALSYLTLCNYYVSGYGAVESMLDAAYAKAVINVVIDSLENHSSFGKVTTEKVSVSLNELFQEKLKTNLKEVFLHSIKPVAFYTDKEAAENNIRTDWIISLDLRPWKVSASSHNYGDMLPAPTGYVAENVVTYIPPAGNHEGNTPQTAYFGNKDVFTYPAPPSSIYYPQEANDFVNILSVKIIDKNEGRKVSPEILTTNLQLPKSSANSSGQMITNSAGIQKIFDNFYVQVKEAISKGLSDTVDSSR